MIGSVIDFEGLLSADFWIGVGVIAGIYGIFTLGLQLNAGFTGILNFGQTGFAAVGAYGIGILVLHGWSLWVALPVAMVAAVVASLAIGFTALRLRAEYFAIATLAFAEIIRHAAQNARQFTGGNQGLYGFDSEWNDVSLWMLDRLDAIGLGSYFQLPLLIVTWGTLALLVAMLLFLQRSPWGRVLRMIREDEDAAAALGKNPFSFKLQSLALAALIGATAGFLIALSLTVIYPDEFDPVVTVIGYAILVLGGLGTYRGVVAATISLWFVLEATRFVDLPLPAEKVASIRFIIVGLVLILVMVFRPQGLFGKRQEMVLRE